MFRSKTTHLFLLLSILSPIYCFASEHFCIAVNGGIDEPNGTTFIGTGFAIPSEGSCTPWAGFTKNTNFILTTTGTGCLSSDGRMLTISLISADPGLLGFNESTLAQDYFTFFREQTKDKFQPINDYGYFGGTADVVTCTSSLLHLPAVHN